jgi:hypothetical protein
MGMNYHRIGSYTQRHAGCTVEQAFLRRFSMKWKLRAQQREEW